LHGAGGAGIWGNSRRPVEADRADIEESTSEVDEACTDSKPVGEKTCVVSGGTTVLRLVEVPEFVEVIVSPW